MYLKTKENQGIPSKVIFGNEYFDVWKNPRGYILYIATDGGTHEKIFLDNSELRELIIGLQKMETL